MKQKIKTYPAYPFMISLTILLVLVVKGFDTWMTTPSRFSAVFRAPSNISIVLASEGSTPVANQFQISRKPVSQPISESEVRVLIAKYFPQIAREKFILILQCENGKYIPNRRGYNTNGSFDIGLAQINSIHRGRVEKIFNISFEDAMSNPDLNIQYAAFLYRHSGFNPWTCAKKVGVI